jgi:hypothetical protein
VREALALATRPNVEGAVLDGGRLALFHRGSGGAPSGRVVLYAGALHDDALGALGVEPCVVTLGALGGVPLGITDAAAGSIERTVFVAAAEDAPDAIADGPVAGCVIGLIERDRVRYARLAAAGGGAYTGKVEGLVVDERWSSAWALTDPDDPGKPSLLCRIELGGFAPRA